MSGEWMTYRPANITGSPVTSLSLKDIARAMEKTYQMECATLLELGVGGGGTRSITHYLFKIYPFLRALHFMYILKS